MKTITPRQPRRLPTEPVPQSHAVAHRHPKAEGPARKSGKPGKTVLSAEAASAALAAAAPAPVAGSVRLPLAGVPPEVIRTLTARAAQGLTDNPYYHLPDTLAALGASLTGQNTIAAQVASLRDQLNAALAAEVNEANLGREILRSAARACEAADNSDEALLSAGWELKKGRSPSVQLPPPARFTLKNTAFPGELTARWSRVANFRFYEIQFEAPANPLASPDWDRLPIISTTSGSYTLPKAAVGTAMHARVRTVGVKGPSPWSEAVTALVL